MQCLKYLSQNSALVFDTALSYFKDQGRGQHTGSVGAFTSVKFQQRVQYTLLDEELS